MKGMKRTNGTRKEKKRERRSTKKEQKFETNSFCNEF
jgi:hypothetical protein